MFCHATVEKEERAGFPAAEKCGTCHVTFPLDAKPFPSARVYQVADFVFFSHARHRAAGVECRACHGTVWQRDVLRREYPTNMKACVECHKARRASVSCSICHELSQ